MSENDIIPRTVLLVEDYDETRYLMRMALEQHGYRVLEAEDGQRAVELALQERPDIILMDLTLPLLDGIQATARIREDAGMRDVPIVAVTAHLENNYRSNAQASGFNAYVTKPIDFDWLDNLLNDLLA
jgi:CheY-like chemotaxis protein